MFYSLTTINIRTHKYEGMILSKVCGTQDSSRV